MVEFNFESSKRLPPQTYSSWLFFFMTFLTCCTLTSSFCPPLCSCNDNSLSVDCHEANNLRMVPIFLNPQTKFLSLAANQIKDISMSFQFYSELQALDFSQNKISSIGENNFENLRNLVSLNVSFNGIHQLEADVFLGLSKTRVLDLSANQLEKIHARAFQGLTSVRELYLDRNRLDALDWDLFQGLESLETLSAKYNFLRVLQPALLAPTSTTWTLKSVRRLDMSWNQITRIKDGGLAVFNGLLDLNLCCNYIHTVEDKAFVPAPANVLRKINLSQNRLTKIPTESLEKLGSSLEEIDLSSNRITDQIPPHSFRGLIQLRVIHLSDNPGIGAIDPAALSDNTLLTEFEADHLSNLTSFSSGLFTNKPFLKIFSLRFASVTVVPEELLTNPDFSEILPTLRLIGNPLDCNCSSLALFQYVNAHSHRGGSAVATNPLQLKAPGENKSSTSSFLPFYDDSSTSPSLGHIQCSTPSHLNGALLQDLRLTDFEHCFERVFFASEHFEILVIGIGAVIVVAIATLIGVKLCCVHGLCKCSGKNPCRCCSKRGKDEKDNKGQALDDFCCSNGRVGTLGRDRDVREYPTIVAAKKVLNLGPEDEQHQLQQFRVPIARGRGQGGGFGTIYSNGSPSTQTGHSSSIPMTFSTTTTSGSPSPLDLDGYLHLARKSNNKLRFDPKMQMPMHLMESAAAAPESPHHFKTQQRHHHHPLQQQQQKQQHPPMILHYEYDYPDYRSMHRVKQVPSVLV